MSVCHVDVEKPIYDRGGARALGRNSMGVVGLDEFRWTRRDNS